MNYHQLSYILTNQKPCHSDHAFCEARLEDLAIQALGADSEAVLTHQYESVWFIY